MNGSTINSGVVGFNIFEACLLEDAINDSYHTCERHLVSVFSNIAQVTFKPEIQPQPLDWYGWYAPEAVDFFDKRFIPAFYDIYQQVGNLFRDYYMRVQDACVSWCVATGTTRPNTGGKRWESGTPAAGGMDAVSKFGPAKSQDKDGNIRISRNITNYLNNCKQSIKTQGDMFENEAINLIKKSAASSFFGMDQQTQLINGINKLIKTINEKTIEITNALITEINASVDKYENIAKQIAAGFNNAIESATAAVNNG